MRAFITFVYVSQPVSKDLVPVIVNVETSEGLNGQDKEALLGV